ncbi:MAG: polyphosphate kinase 1, partial [Spirochaetota bacterium]
MGIKISKDNPSIFFDRELSWLDFNYRVLEEAADPSNPILERLKFLCITESNLDEFYMVRVAGLKNATASGMDGKSFNGMSFSEVIQAISQKVSAFVKSQYDILVNSILPELRENGINILEDPSALTAEEVDFVKKYYKEEVSSILTPLAIDTAHPFPHVLNKTLNLVITLCPVEDTSDARKALSIVQVPSVLPRFLRLPSSKPSEHKFFPLESVIKMHLDDLFYGMIVKEVHPFKIIRDSDIDISDDAKDDLLTSVKLELKNRIWGEAVKIDINKNASPLLQSLLKESLNVQEHEVFPVPHLLRLGDMMYFYGLENTSKLKFPYIKPRSKLNVPSLDKIFSIIRKEDKLLHHPYDSFQDVESVLKFASGDPKVLGIKMT